MHRTRHRQSAVQWNPPPLAPDAARAFEPGEQVVSATECTGLTPQPLDDTQQARVLSDLYAIHTMKPQGNIGKGNPLNDPEEIEFHRGHTEESPS